MISIILMVESWCGVDIPVDQTRERKRGEFGCGKRTKKERIEKNKQHQVALSTYHAHIPRIFSGIYGYIHVLQPFEGKKSCFFPHSPQVWSAPGNPFQMGLLTLFSKPSSQKKANHNMHANRVDLLSAGDGWLAGWLAGTMRRAKNAWPREVQSYCAGNPIWTCTAVAWICVFNK